MSTHESLNSIIEIFRNGNESEMFVSTVKYVFDTISAEKENSTYNINNHADSVILIHNRLRYKHNADFNGPLLSWYRRYIGLHGEQK